MVQKIVYSGPVERVYDLISFRNFITSLNGMPITSAYQPEHNGERYCAWKLPSNVVVSLKHHYPSAKKELHALVMVKGTKKESSRLAKIILEEAGNKEKWARLEGKAF